jgi:hypothetical protein
MKYFLFKTIRRVINLILLIGLWYRINSNKVLLTKYGEMWTKVCEALWRGRILRLRPAYLLGSVLAVWQAKKIGADKVVLVEFGVASGTGLINLIRIGELLSSLFGVKISVYGFDNCAGLPPPKNALDHPEIWSQGQFDMASSKNTLESYVNAHACHLIEGDITEDLILRSLEADLSNGVLGFVSIDVDYYSSTKPIMQAFSVLHPSKLLPAVSIYFDDVADNFSYNHRCGEELAIEEFNETNSSRVIELKIPSLSIYSLNVLDNEFRTGDKQVSEAFEIPCSILSDMVVK